MPGSFVMLRLQALGLVKIGPDPKQSEMLATVRLKSRIKEARRAGAWWVKSLDLLRLVRDAGGRSELWTRLLHNAELHQANPHTEPDRYPELFDQAAKLSPGPKRILSFGCSTGEELISLRQRFPRAEIVGAEINPRSRRIAARRLSSDSAVTVVKPGSVDGSFDIVFALSVLQWRPHTIAEMGVEDLSSYYPFERFDTAVSKLVNSLRPHGLLCVINAHYPVEESSAADLLDAIDDSGEMDEPLFSRDGRILRSPAAKTLFRKRA